MHPYRISNTAKEDIENLLDYSYTTFGLEAALRYENLLKVSINTLRDDPEQAGVKSSLKATSKFHLSQSKRQAAIDDVTVTNPRHIIFFRVENDTLEIIRVLHESMDFERHL